jgi:hypothetical protein
METLKLKLLNAWKSFTIWFNAAMIGALQYADNIISTVKENLPMLSQYLTADFLKGAAIMILVVNIALRFKTSQALHEK